MALHNDSDQLTWCVSRQYNPTRQLNARNVSERCHVVLSGKAHRLVPLHSIHQRLVSTLRGLNRGHGRWCLHCRTCSQLLRRSRSTLRLHKHRQSTISDGGNFETISSSSTLWYNACFSSSLRVPTPNHQGCSAQCCTQTFAASLFMAPIWRLRMAFSVASLLFAAPNGFP